MLEFERIWKFDLYFRHKTVCKSRKENFNNDIIIVGARVLEKEKMIPFMIESAPNLNEEMDGQKADFCITLCLAGATKIINTSWICFQEQIR